MMFTLDLNFMFITFLLLAYTDSVLGLTMNLSHALENSVFSRIVLVLWFANSFFTVFLLGRIDWIVHNELYDYGLQFNYVWANPYWFSIRLIYVCLAVPSFLSAVLLGSDLWSKLGSRKSSTRSNVKQAERKSQMLTSCPSCRKTFGKSLVMLDFSSGRTRLVNVCPYCNMTLGDTSKNVDEKDLETRVLTPNEKVKTKHQ